MPIRYLFLFVLIFKWANGQEKNHFNTNSSPDSLPATIFTLGEVVVRGRSTTNPSTTIGSGKIRLFEKNDVARAMNLLPGVNLSSVGPRNEAMVYVRGFDLRQVPLLIDGIPVYIPYDGYVDLGRFTTFDLSAIEVSKGYTSVNYGPNSLGGAINLYSRKPGKHFELDGSAGWLSGGYRADLNIGANFGKFYVQAGASKLERDSFPLSNHFSPAKTEEGGWRNNSWNTDEKLNIKLGYSPGRKSEYAISYIYQHGKKGSPPYAGTDTLNGQFRNPRYWQWPYWNKQSLYFISNTHLDSNQYVKTRLYYDQFKNLLNSYDDASYSTISRPYAFKSYYDDYSFGGILEYGNRFGKRNRLTATAQYKQDMHREQNEGEPVRHMSDGTFTVGLENEYSPSSKWIILTGISYNNRKSIQAEDYNSVTKEITDFPTNDNGAWNLQAGLEYRYDEGKAFQFSVAHKTRFATMKDRYSYRLGTAVPNPDLNAEQALNFDLNYNYRKSERLNFQTAIFYSRVNNTIQMVSNVAYDSARNVWLSQLQNVGESENFGMELGANFILTAYLDLGASYTYIQKKNKSNPSIHFVDVPRNKFFCFVYFHLKDRFFIQGNMEYNSDRYSTSYGTISGSFAVLNSKAGLRIWKGMGIEGGINNLTDTNYSLVEGYPEAGRNYFTSLVLHLR